jgi:hypothetical protein
MVDPDKDVTRHRATYILEMGVWRATCRACGYSVTDPRRRQAAAVFRNHIREKCSRTELKASVTGPDSSSAVLPS